ncbi:hypothetical protein HY29_11110 [Hyphomonas beringensis]|uniref:Peptidase inhibitor I78 family protein n=1 Tax=Hyphomonas beringensis TaxID=1280946 RepID=A0A062UBL9_9PROT|nr:I78 family peptidase inhibitor [Hyphomonas beringensis]KCZ55667.1 hypothetical protein HY29_11110 [Hyphomonas beringensis]
MKMRTFLLASSAALLLAACGGESSAPADDEVLVTEPPVVVTPDETPAEDMASDESVTPEMDPLDQVEDTCGMTDLESYIGQVASEIPEDELPESARIVAPDTQVTEDYRPTRLNVLTDEDGIILSMKCG